VLFPAARAGEPDADGAAAIAVKLKDDKDDADDLTIEAFGKAFKRLAQYTPQYAFSTWLFKIASNNCIDHIRRKRIRAVSIDQGFSNEDGYHILWQFSDSVDGEWWMGVLQDGRWQHFQMDLGNRKQRESFFQGQIPDGTKPA
jgi:RNA polymerase sigma factor (sigma-70 family)